MSGYDPKRKLMSLRAHRAKWPTGRNLNRQIREPATADHAGAGPDSRADAQCATIIGNLAELSGESRSISGSFGISRTSRAVKPGAERRRHD